jgi:excinuclease ABC subunit A
MQDHIVIKGAREHNLKDVSLTVPRNSLIVFTGLSGSGKSSLAFDTIFAEGQRRYVESLSAYARQFLGQMSKPDVDEITGLSPAISIDQKAHSANPRSTVATITEIYDYLRVLYARIGKPNCPNGHGPIRKLTGEQMVEFILQDAPVAYELAAEDAKAKKKKEAADTVILAPVVRGRKGEYHQMLYDFYNAGFSSVRINGRIRSLRTRLVLDRNMVHNIELVVDTFTRHDVLAAAKAPKSEDTKVFRQRLAEAVESAMKYGQGVVTALLGDGSERTFSTQFSCGTCGFSFPEIEPRLFSFNSPYGACQTCHGLGVKHLYSEELCEECGGKRLRKESLCVLVGEKNIVELTSLGIGEASAFLSGLKLVGRDADISVSVMKEIINRLRFLLDVGLHYLSLGRTAGTLSGGEAQRIRLASQIGSGLVGALYVLDEPSIGLHQRDNEKLLATLKHLRDIGNTIIVVEHDEDTMRAADWLVEFGPGAGKNGGYITLTDAMPAALKDKDSLTMKYLRGERRIPVPAVRRTKNPEHLTVVGATANNLNNVNVDIPLRRLVCVTGVSGSGKSTLVGDIVARSLSQKLNGSREQPGKHKMITGLEWLDRMVEVDQSPIGRTPRSNPATYTGIWTPVRELFASTEEARFRGYSHSRFSFNRPGGRCENCEGNGQIAIEMHFLPTVFVTCDVCHGKRFDHETLQVLYRNKSIHDVLEMSVDEAAEFFREIPQVFDAVKVLQEVGLGYIQLGQSATTLSGGEAQRVKLAYELSKRAQGKTLFILDEPTTGLHFEDIRKLLEVLSKLVERGNSVLVIEHNLDVIKCADYLIDLGPEGGAGGGKVVATGTPEEVAKYGESYTAKYLKRTLGV